MAISLLPTKVEMRAELFSRLGMETQGAQAAADTGLIDSWIRRSNKRLWLECSWLRSRTRFSIPLVTGQSEYDWPDNVDSGSLELMEVANTSGLLFPLTIGIDEDIFATGRARQCHGQQSLITATDEGDRVVTRGLNKFGRQQRYQRRVCRKCQIA